jgi:hypothetical protein
MRGPSGVTTTSSSIRAAENPSLAGQYVSSANDHARLQLDRSGHAVQPRDDRPLM